VVVIAVNEEKGLRFTTRDGVEWVVNRFFTTRNAKRVTGLELHIHLKAS
jgi:hypothetical protein